MAENEGLNYICKEIKKRRIELGLTQVELAEKTGFHQAHISKYERGTVPMVAALTALAEVLGPFEISADLKERAEFDEKIEITANHARSLVEHVRRQADEQARDITRHEQRLAALKSEYASEYETQVTKIMADEETWKSAAKHGFDEHAIAYVKEREAEIRGANKLGVGTTHVPQAQIIKRDAIREFVTGEDDEQRAT